MDPNSVRKELAKTMNETKQGSKDNTLLTPKDVANQLGVSPVTVRVWAQENKLPFVTTPGGHRRFNQSDVDKFSQQHGGRKSSAYSILIVDDDEQHAELLSEYFRYMPLEVNTFIAHDGFEAGQLINQVNPDCVLLDLMMPGMDGFSVCQRIKEHPATNRIRVIAMTGYTDKENIQKIMQAGAERCLSKPINRDIINELFE